MMFYAERSEGLPSRPKSRLVKTYRDDLDFECAFLRLQRHLWSVTPTTWAIFQDGR